MTLKEVYDKVRESVQDDQVEDNFSRDLLNIVYTSSIGSGAKWQDELLKPRSGKYSVKSATEEKDKGTKAFRQGNLQEALEIYTNYLRMCHGLNDEAEDKRKMIYQGYANRSLVLLKANAFDKCFDDCEAALHYSQTSGKSEYMILDRQARCHLFRSKWGPARAKFQEALDAAEASGDLKDEMKEAFKAQVMTNIRKIPPDAILEELEKVKNQTEDEDFVMDATDFLIKVESKHPDHKGMTSKAKVAYSDAKGRYVVAKEKIGVGEVIVTENPNVSFTHFDKTLDRSRACHHCVQELGYVRQPSPIVDGIEFCCLKCLRLAVDSYHKYEGFILDDYLSTVRSTEEAVEQSGCMFLAMRAVARNPVGFYCANPKSAIYLKQDSKFGLDQDKDNLDLDQLRTMNMFNLVCHEQECPLEERIKTACRSIILLVLLRDAGYFKSKDINVNVLSPEELVIAELLYRYQLGVTHNVHSIYRLGGDMSGQIPMEMIGSAIYHDTVLFNHSCSANTTRFFQGGQMVLIAKRTILEGEEIFNNYGVHHNNMNLERRQAALRSGYKFGCDCDACANDYPKLNKVDSQLPDKDKKVGKELNGLLAKYQKLFADGCLEEARDRCVDYVAKLEQKGIKYPHRNYEIGSIAMNSCFWGIISRQSQIDTSKHIAQNDK